MSFAICFQKKSKKYCQGTNLFCKSKATQVVLILSLQIVLLVFKRQRQYQRVCRVFIKWLLVFQNTLLEVAEWNKRWSPPFPCCPVSLQWP